jgi:hypothetical protein
MQDIQEDVLQAMNNANLPPEFAYAYRNTGLLGLSADKSFWPPEHIAERNAAIDEYRAIEDAKRASSPKQKSRALAESDEDSAKFIGFTPEEFERWQHSHNHPGFKGDVEFDIMIEVLGARVERRAHVNFEYTPEWEYWNLKKGALFTGFLSSVVDLVLLTVADEPEDGEETPEIEGYDDEDDPSPPAWVDLDLARDRMLSRAVWDRIYDFVDEECKGMDQERRRAHARGLN